MCGIDPIFAHPDFRLWLQGDIQSPKIDFRLTPNSGHSEAHAGLPFVTHKGHYRLSSPGLPSAMPLR